MTTKAEKKALIEKLQAEYDAMPDDVVGSDKTRRIVDTSGFTRLPYVRTKTLRDEFAMAAMQGLIQNRCYPVDNEMPRYAYKAADAMLEARK